MLAVVALVAALAASAALASPSGIDIQQTGFQQGSSLKAPYTVQVIGGGRYVGPAALVSDRYALCAAHLIADSAASSLSVKAGTELSFRFNPFGQTVRVASVLVHPDAALGADVAVLELAKPVSIKSASTIPIAGPVAAPPGSLAVVSGWGGWLSLAVAHEWLVLDKYCDGREARDALARCATAAASKPPGGAVVAVDGQLAGFVTGQGVEGLVSYVDLADASVKKFVAAAIAKPTEVPEEPTDRPADQSVDQPAEKPADKPSPPSRAAEPAEPAEPATASKAGKTCGIRADGGLPSAEPILLADGLPLAFREPDSADGVQLAAGDRVRLICPGKGNHFKKFKSRQDLTAECVQGADYLVDGQRVALPLLGCKTIATHSARANGTCGDRGQYTRIVVGFGVGDDFVTQIENCFDRRTFDAVYSRSVMTPAIADHESGVKRPSFTPAGFYEQLNPNALYGRASQRAALAQLLGSAELADKYVTDDQAHFLARGHLSAKADFVLSAQQRATFYYVNAAPQWQSFNGDNWEKLESSVRDWVAASGRAAVHVVTGTWGVATLPDKDGVETGLYLEADRKYLRVPKYYWKVVYDPATGEAAAFVGLNNPYHVTTSEDVLCEDVCARYPWLSWRPNEQARGYGFCCDVRELRKVVTTIPADLDVRALL